MNKTDKEKLMKAYKKNSGRKNSNSWGYYEQGINKK